MSTETTPAEQAEARWQPLSANQRRVLGVLIEKAKTTPDAYPMTLNALTNGCNQKSNRSPQMDLSPDAIEQALEELREFGAAAEVQSSGRVSKYRHYAYEWLGVDKVELAVMAELLLRGEQTVGELRGRAARMEPIADLNTLRPIVESLAEKNLIVSLTPTGRGQVITHNLYRAERMEDLKREYASGHAPSATTETSSPSRRSFAVSSEQFAALEEEVSKLRSQVEQLTADLAALKEMS